MPGVDEPRAGVPGVESGGLRGHGSLPPTQAARGARWRNRTTVLCAGLCIAGLISSTTLQLRAPALEILPAVVPGSQQLSVGGSSDGVFQAEAFEVVEDEPVGLRNDLDSASFVNNPEAAVQYPFTQGVPLTDGFGYREYPVEQMHAAQDFAADAGTPIRAIADGVVLEAGYAADGCGYGVKLQHLIAGKVTTSRYCHQQEGSLAVQQGDRVFVGQVLGRVGNTGWSFGPHLHLEIAVEGERLDPMVFLGKHNGTWDK